MKAARYWLMSAACCAVAWAAGSPATGEPPPPSSAAPSGQRSSPGAGSPSDDFIEFLGAEDVEDAAWWEFLKKSAPRKEQPPVTPPQDSKQ